MRLWSTLILTCLLSLMASSVLAQEDTTCPELVQTAYETTQSACEEAGRDEACYGNNLVTADAQPEAEEFTFEAPGDVEEVGDIATLRLSSMDMSAAEWGISMIRIQADLPETSESYVELLLFGNVEIENQGGTDAPEATAEPSTDPQPTYRAMQAFYFTSGTDDRPCEEAPDSGILIQTPEGEGEITVLVNEVVIELGSTAYLQAQPNSDMVISTVEGQATVTAEGATVIAPAGTFTTVPLDANGLADGAPTEPQPYDENNLATLPIGLLSREIAIAPALTAGTSSTGTLPTPGQWSFEYVACSLFGNEDDGTSVTIVHEGDGFTLGNAEFSFGLFLPTELGVFVSNTTAPDGTPLVTTITVNAPDALSGDLNIGNGMVNCTFTLALDSAE